MGVEVRSSFFKLIKFRNEIGKVIIWFFLRKSFLSDVNLPKDDGRLVIDVHYKFMLSIAMS